MSLLCKESPVRVKLSISKDDGYVPNGFSIATVADVIKKENLDSTINQIIKSNSYDTDEDDGDDEYGPSKPKSCKWPQRPEQLLKHVCAQCGMEFGKESFMEQHLDNMHAELHTSKNLKINITSPTAGECQICGAHVHHRSLRDLQAHYFLHLQYKSFKCKCHNYHFQDKQSGLQHLKFHAQQTMLRKTPVFDTEHEKQHCNGSKILEDGNTYDPQYPETGIRFVCPECGEEYACGDHWKKHVNNSHDFKSLEGLNMTKLDTMQVRCNECNTNISWKSDTYKLRRHKVTHSPFKAFHCKLCKYARKRKEDVVHHIRQSHVRSGEMYYKL